MFNWLPIGLGFAAASIIGFGIHTISASWTEAKHQRELTEQREQLIASCEADKKITQEVSSEYQSKIRSLNNQLARLKRVQPHCILPETNPSGGHNGTAAGKLVPSGNGVNTEYLYDFAARAEETRLKLLGCQDFINRTQN